MFFSHTKFPFYRRFMCDVFLGLSWNELGMTRNYAVIFWFVSNAKFLNFSNYSLRYPVRTLSRVALETAIKVQNRTGDLRNTVICLTCMRNLSPGLVIHFHRPHSRGNLKPSVTLRLENLPVLSLSTIGNSTPPMCKSRPFFYQENFQHTQNIENKVDSESPRSCW